MVHTATYGHVAGTVCFLTLNPQRSRSLADVIRQEFDCITYYVSSLGTQILTLRQTFHKTHEEQRLTA